MDLEAFCNDNCSFCTTRKENGYNNEMLKLLNIDKKKPSSNDFRPIGELGPNSHLKEEMANSLPSMMKEAQIPAIELTGGGEPTLWPEFDRLIENLAENDIEIGLVTNGSKISDFRARLLAKHCIGLDSPWMHPIEHYINRCTELRIIILIKELTLLEKSFN